LITLRVMSGEQQHSKQGIKRQHRRQSPLPRCDTQRRRSPAVTAGTGRMHGGPRVRSSCLHDRWQCSRLALTIRKSCSK
jgi:hypothetical protein